MGILEVYNHLSHSLFYPIQVISIDNIGYIFYFKPDNVVYDVIMLNCWAIETYEEYYFCQTCLVLLFPFFQKWSSPVTQEKLEKADYFIFIR